MNNIKNFLKIVILFTIFFISSVSAASVWPNKNSYNFGETVLIYGSGFTPNQDVAIEIDNPNDVFLFSNQTTPDDNGNFTSFYLISDHDSLIMIEGTYKIYANSQSESAQTTFSVSSSASTTTTTTSTTTTTTITTMINNINYIEVNGTTFIQSEIINITGWSGNSSSYTYLWNNYTGTIQSMRPDGIGVQTNITSSSNLNVGCYSVYCNSTWNSTLASKTFNVATMTTSTPTTAPNGNNEGVTTTTSTTTTISTTTSSGTTSTSINTITTTTIPEEEQKATKTWYVILIILICVGIGIAIYYFKYMEKSNETKNFELLKRKWTK
jgi:hypothetical protein